MAKQREKRIAAVAMVLGVIVIVAVVLLFRDAIPGLSPSGSREPLPRSPSFTGRVDIAQGSILVNEFASFLESFTGLTVVVDSEVAQKPVVVIAPIEDADGEIARTLLESSGCVVTREKLPNGREILSIRAADE